MDIREAVLYGGLAGVVGEINIQLPVETNGFVQGIHAFVKRVEPRVPFFLLSLALASCLVFAFVSFSDTADGPASTLKAGLITLTSLGAFLCGLSASIMVYRLGPWHPLAKYPGPIGAKLSKWWMAYCIAHGHRHLKLQECVDHKFLSDKRPITIQVA